MIYWLRALLGVDIAEASIKGIIDRIDDVDLRLDHVAKRVTRNENDINDLDNYVFPRKHRP